MFSSGLNKFGIPLKTEKHNMIYFIIFIAIIFIPVFLGVGIYNNLQRKKILVSEGWSSIGASLQQRNDLIPNLVETVEGYAQHENSTLNEVTKWRNQSAAAKTPGEQNEIQTEFQKAIVNVMAVSENYPQLKADVQFQQLQTQLATIEEKIKTARENYNIAVREYNSQIVVFPGNIVAGYFNMTASEFFVEEEHSRTVPRVSFK